MNHQLLVEVQIISTGDTVRDLVGDPCIFTYLFSEEFSSGVRPPSLSVVSQRRHVSYTIPSLPGQQGPSSHFPRRWVSLYPPNTSRPFLTYRNLLLPVSRPRSFASYHLVTFRFPSAFSFTPTVLSSHRKCFVGVLGLDLPVPKPRVLGRSKRRFTLLISHLRNRFSGWYSESSL